jgi:hypothetical protein
MKEFKRWLGNILKYFLTVLVAGFGGGLVVNIMLTVVVFLIFACVHLFDSSAGSIENPWKMFLYLYVEGGLGGLFTGIFLAFLMFYLPAYPKYIIKYKPREKKQSIPNAS